MESTSLPFNPYSPFGSKTISRRRGGATILQIRFNRTAPLRLQFARRLSNFSLEGEHLVVASRNWNSNKGGAVIRKHYGDRHNEEEDEDEEEEEQSLDLLVKFVESMFKKISKRARKAVRSVLPVTIPTKLVRFSVEGVIILTFLWVLKAFLEVVCTLGSVVFISILVIRGVWTGISSLQEIRNHRQDEFDESAWSGTQPAT